MLNNRSFEYAELEACLRWIDSECANTRNIYATKYTVHEQRLDRIGYEICIFLDPELNSGFGSL